MQHEYESRNCITAKNVQYYNLERLRDVYRQMLR